MTAHITLSKAIEVLLRVLVVIKTRRPILNDVDLVALGTVIPESTLGSAWGVVLRALLAAREDLEVDGPLSSRRGAPNDAHVTAALLRDEALEAVDGVLVEVAQHYLPRARGLLLCDVAELVEGLDGAPLEAAGIREAWRLVYRAVHQRASGAPTLQPGEPGDEGDDGPAAERTVPEFVVEFPAIGVGPGVDRRLAALAREMRELLALHANTAPRGRGLVLQLRIPVNVRREERSGALKRVEGL